MTESKSVGSGDLEGQGEITGGHEEFSGWWMCWLSWLWWWFHECTHVKTYEIAYFKQVEIIVCQSYVNKVSFIKQNNWLIIGAGTVTLALRSSSKTQGPNVRTLTKLTPLEERVDNSSLNMQPFSGMRTGNSSKSFTFHLAITLNLQCWLEKQIRTRLLFFSHL